MHMLAAGDQSVFAWVMVGWFVLFVGFRLIVVMALSRPMESRKEVDEE